MEDEAMEVDDVHEVPLFDDWGQPINQEAVQMNVDANEPASETKDVIGFEDDEEQEPYNEGYVWTLWDKDPVDSGYDSVYETTLYTRITNRRLSMTVERWVMFPPIVPTNHEIMSHSFPPITMDIAMVMI